MRVKQAESGYIYCEKPQKTPEKQAKIKEKTRFSGEFYA